MLGSESVGFDEQGPASGTPAYETAPPVRDVAGGHHNSSFFWTIRFPDAMAFVHDGIAVT